MIYQHFQLRKQDQCWQPDRNAADYYNVATRV